MKKSMCILGLLVALGTAGCVERKMTITSTPPGAIVYISDVEKGRTPLTVDFTWYGDYDVIVRRQGYQTLKTHAELNAPLYEIPPLDLLSAIAPWTYHDRRYLHFDLQKIVPSSDSDLVGRADALAKQNLQAVPR